MRDQEEAAALNIKHGPRVREATAPPEKPTEEITEGEDGHAFTCLRIHAKPQVRADNHGTWSCSD